jgi:hypothetical protein
MGGGGTKKGNLDDFPEKAKHILEILGHCHARENFYSLGAILSGLFSETVW